MRIVTTIMWRATHSSWGTHPSYHMRNPSISRIFSKGWDCASTSTSTTPATTTPTPTQRWRRWWRSWISMSSVRTYRNNTTPEYSRYTWPPGISRAAIPPKVLTTTMVTLTAPTSAPPPTRTPAATPATAAFPAFLPTSVGIFSRSSTLLGRS